MTERAGKAKDIALGLCRGILSLAMLIGGIRKIIGNWKDSEGWLLTIGAAFLLLFTLSLASQKSPAAEEQSSDKGSNDLDMLPRITLILGGVLLAYLALAALWWGVKHGEVILAIVIASVVWIVKEFGPPIFSLFGIGAAAYLLYAIIVTAIRDAQNR